MERITITQADTAAEIQEVAALFAKYAATLDVDLSFQQFDAELQQLGTMYARPHGAILLARSPAAIAGCVAVRRLNDHIAELKRMYIRPAFRGTGLGRQLLERGIALARGLGYTALRLDTLPSMTAAIALYRAFGFREIEAYRFNPVGGTLFFELEL